MVSRSQLCHSLTLASHSIPATEIPSSRMTVRVPTMRMSFSSSVIRASTSCTQQGERSVRTSPPSTDRLLVRWHGGFSHIKHLYHCLCEAYDIHGHSHGVGKGKDETNGASKLGPQAPGDQVVRSTWTTATHYLHKHTHSTIWQSLGASLWHETCLFVKSLDAATSPPRTKPLVAMAEVDRPVMVVTTVAIKMMAMVSARTGRHIETDTEEDYTKHSNTYRPVCHLAFMPLICDALPHYL